MPLNRQKQRELGLCTECPRPVKPSYLKCEYHLEYTRQSCIRKRKRRIEENRCSRCGKPMIDTGLIDGAKTKCVNCNEYKFIW